ncbi:DUF2958 domain-containing protein [Candidatus Gottesmanbacteria bacterium]|nr:DUF2958 domain-containing protein [Candidatus Gottesmanbacteria bacterium]
MWNKPSVEELDKLPRFYSTEGVPFKEKLIVMHFFMGGSDWFAAEYDPGEKTFFGFVILNADYEMAEWGYFSLQELSELKVSFLEVDRDLYWTPRKAVEVEQIRKAEGWQEEVVNQVK